MVNIINITIDIIKNIMLLEELPLSKEDTNFFVFFI